MRPLLARLAFLSLGASVAACDVYDSSLLEGGANAGGEGTGNTPVGGEGAGAGPVACETPDQCGENNECGTRTCEDNVCGVNAQPEGTVTAEQMSGDCLQNECDGQGNIIGIIDDADVPTDTSDCTDDACTEGIPSNDPVGVGATCDQGGGQVCNEAGQCVECVDGSDCPSGICTDTFECAAATCDDGLINNGETDLNCGGPNCPGCEEGQSCLVGTDCISMSCGGAPLECQPTCTDGILNQNESDLDCGGVCPDCTFGQDCNAATDCDTGSCSGGGICTCPANNGVVIISEVRTRGVLGGNDEFVELYNPGTASVTLTNTWTISSRTEDAMSFTVRWTGSGQVVPPNEHILIGGTAYAGPPTADATLTSGITDEVSVRVQNAGVTVDVVCVNCGGSTFVGGPGGHECEGAPAQKVGCASNVDESVERKPGGALGNCIDTQDNLTDFAEIAPSNPQNLASPPTP